MLWDTMRCNQECREAVDKLAARYGWQLMEREEHIGRAVVHLCSGIASDAYRAAVYAYSCTLYGACSGAEGSERQNLGYSELRAYLNESASRRYSDVGEDALQRALESAFINFGRCRHPGAFLAFAKQRLADAARSLRRQAQEAPVSLYQTIGNQQRMLVDLLADPQQRDPCSELIVEEGRKRFAECAREFRRKHPRARQQLAALWMKHIDGLDETAISRQLGKPVHSVYVLRCRGVNQLRRELNWRALAVDLGIVAD